MKALVVCTGKRGVFFGYGDVSQPDIRLERARMCVYWSADVKGILGLAATGPSKDCRVTAEVPAITLNDVTAVMEVSDEAEKAWQAQPWK
jgi:hypothetical protein